MIFKTKLHFTILLLNVLFISSCIDPIDYEVPAGVNASIVIQGRVVRGTPSFVEVGVSRLFDFSPESRQPVSVRKVVLSDTNGNDIELETRTPGSYKLILDGSTPIKAEIGEGYKLRVETFDNRIFESSSDVMQPVGKPKSLHTSIVQVQGEDILGNPEPQDRVQLSIDTELDNSTDGGIYWEVNNVFKVTDAGINDSDGIIKTCYVTQTANSNNIHVLDPGLLAGGMVENYDLGNSPIDFRFGEGIYYEVRQYSLSPGAFKYWNGVNILSEREGNMFDGPVGEVASNFENVEDPNDFVFGYFFASDEELIRIKVDSDISGRIRPRCDPPGVCFSGPGGDCICGLCCDCLLDPSATTTKPGYWID